jgi:formylglycine-generating enzyme required for sulfatase activity
VSARCKQEYRDTIVRFLRFVFLTLTILVPAMAQTAEIRIALVIGNSDYASGPLPNPVNDAKLISDALTKLGFTVIVRLDADQVTMKRGIQDLGAHLNKAGPEAVGLFYYAGHGVQLNGRNYLIPTKANIEREGDVEMEAVSADWVLEQMRYAHNHLNIVVLDACRNNPFTRSMRSVNHGLAAMDAPSGILIAYSTGPGDVAADGNGRNSPYTQALAQLMRKNREPVEQVFKHVRVSVMNTTGGKQVPWELSSLTGDFYFLSPRNDFAAPSTDLAASSSISPGTTPAPLPALLPASLPAPDYVAGPSKPSLFGTWIDNWRSFGTSVSGWFSSKPSPSTATKVATFSAPKGKSTDLLTSGTRAVLLLKTLGIRANDVDSDHSYPQSVIRHLIESAPRKVTLGSTSAQIRAAFALCQRYAGTCKPSDYADEGLRFVTLEPYELDPVPVSVGMFREFASATHYVTQAERDNHAYAWVDGKKKQIEGGSWKASINKRPVEEDSPVVAVSFDDAVAYCRFKGSRLPSEDEWEYMARGPQRSVFPWGNDVSPVARSLSMPPRINDGPTGGIGGRFKGLSGTVWQWVDANIDRGTIQGLKHDYGPQWSNPKVLKGGSWLESNPADKRAAVRRYEVPERAFEDNGFRCAKLVSAWADADIWLSQLQFQ